MDNTPEISKSLKDLDIPKKWDFLDRDYKGYEVIQMELGEGFLAYTLPDTTFRPDTAFKGDRDYFFSAEGKPLALRWYLSNLLMTQINLEGEISVGYNIREYILPKKEESHEPRITVHFLTRSPDSSTSSIIGRVEFSRNLAIEKISLSIDFSRDNKGNWIESPCIILKRDEQAHDVWAFKLDRESMEHIYYPRGIPFVFETTDKDRNELVIFNKIGQGKKENTPVFKVNWEIHEGSLVVCQTHLPTDIAKTIRSNLSLDEKEINDVVYSRPPYPKDEKGRLVVPWRHIDRIVGASLSYSYPPRKI